MVKALTPLHRGGRFESLPIKVKICSVYKDIYFYFHCYSNLPIYHLLYYCAGVLMFLFNCPRPLLNSAVIHSSPYLPPYSPPYLTPYSTPYSPTYSLSSQLFQRFRTAELWYSLEGTARYAGQLLALAFGRGHFCPSGKTGAYYAVLGHFRQFLVISSNLSNF